MSILNHLYSQLTQRDQSANTRAAEKCLADPSLLVGIAEGLNSKDTALAGDCAEVFTKVAEIQPQAVVAYGPALTQLIRHKNTRVRWESTHALALIAALAPSIISPILADLEEIIRTDKSIIVRDYSVDIVGNYAKSGTQSSEEAYPILKEALNLWDKKHAGHALAGLANVARQEPALRTEIQAIGKQFSNDTRGVVKKAAKQLVRVASN